MEVITQEAVNDMIAKAVEYGIPPAIIDGVPHFVLYHGSRPAPPGAYEVYHPQMGRGTLYPIPSA
jgi:hypothetical protein